MSRMYNCDAPPATTSTNTNMNQTMNTFFDATLDEKKDEPIELPQAQPQHNMNINGVIEVSSDNPNGIVLNDLFRKPMTSQEGMRQIQVQQIQKQMALAQPKKVVPRVGGIVRQIKEG
jgi:hypothetical protein